MDDVLSGADIDIYGLADATRRRANGMGKSLHADGAILSRMDLSTAVRGRPDLKVGPVNSANEWATCVLDEPGIRRPAGNFDKSSLVFVL